MKRAGGSLSCAAIAFIITVGAVNVRGDAVVTDGKFTNIYVYQPSFAGETWEQHLNAYWSKNRKPKDPDKFTRASIDAFVDALMTPGSPSYFDWLHQYSGINPPRFLGSGVASASCVAAAMKDANNGVIQWDTLRSLANCHRDGYDPSPQVTLIFSPDIKIGNTPTKGSGDICTTSTQAWHWAGVNTPNYIALPTNPGCAGSFDTLTTTLSHEIVETLTNPAGFGVGGALNNPTNEIGDRCEGKSTTWTSSGYKVTQYWSNRDRNCQPAIVSPWASATVTTPEHAWLDVSELPLVRFTDKHHDHPESLSPQDVGDQVLRLQLIISTGNDGLRGGKDNCDVTIQLKNGRTISLPNINQSNEWGGWSIHTIDVPLPAGGLKGGDVTNLQLHVGSSPNNLTDSPDNWNLERIQLKATVLTPLIGPGGGGGPAITQVPVSGNQASGAPFDGVWVENVYAKNSKYVVRITSKQTPFGTVRVASYQISVNELAAPGNARVTFETEGKDLFPTLARVPDQPDAEHMNLPNGVSLYLYRILNNGSFLNYGIRYVRFADHLMPDKKSTVRRKMVDTMLQPLQTPPH
jgi:hypothetical protein